jgi:hypothetical protein
MQQRFLGPLSAQRTGYLSGRASELRALASYARGTLSVLATEPRRRADLMERGHDEMTAYSIVARRHSRSPEDDCRAVVLLGVRRAGATVVLIRAMLVAMSRLEDELTHIGYGRCKARWLNLVSVKRTQGIAVLALAAVTLALPLGAGAQSQQTQLVIKLLSISSGTTHDLAPKGPSVGDWETEHSILYNAAPQFDRPVGAKVGSDSGKTVITGLPASAVVHGITRLPGGTLIVSGHPRFINGGELNPVTGGTGRFAGARGTGFAINLAPPRGGRQKAINVYRITVSGP